MLLQDPIIILEITALAMTIFLMASLTIFDGKSEKTDNSFNTNISGKLETIFDVGKSVFIPKHYLSDQRIASRS